MVWYGMVWYGVVWCGMVWYGMVWYGLVWYGVVWYGSHRCSGQPPTANPVEGIPHGQSPGTTVRAIRWLVIIDHLEIREGWICFIILSLRWYLLIWYNWIFRWYLWSLRWYGLVIVGKPVGHWGNNRWSSEVIPVGHWCDTFWSLKWYLLLMEVIPVGHWCDYCSLLMWYMLVIEVIPVCH